MFRNSFIVFQYFFRYTCISVVFSGSCFMSFLWARRSWTHSKRCSSLAGCLVDHVGECICTKRLNWSTCHLTHGLSLPISKNIVPGFCKRPVGYRTFRFEQIATWKTTKKQQPRLVSLNDIYKCIFLALLFTARPYCWQCRLLYYRDSVCPSLRPSVFPSHSGVLSRWIKIRSCGQKFVLQPGLPCSRNCSKRTF